MRTDQYAYQQATRIAGLGLLLQLAIGLVLLIFGRAADSTAFTFASFYALGGVLLWASLVVTFHQHRLAAVERMEADELRDQRGGTVFEGERALDAAVAERRLRQMHSVMLPAVSLVLAAGLGLGGFITLRSMQAADDALSGAASFAVGGASGWQLAVCVALSLVAFILSRFVAGMSRQPVWQSLRGGAGYMVGTALLLLAIGAGLVFNVFERPGVLEGVVYGIGVFQIFVAAEIVLNFILNLYRPRRKGELPRPAFDSRVLSLFAAPDNIVRSINEAVNYQFGFDISSSWGYQLLLRSVAWLTVLGAGVLVLLSCVVVVPPGQQAVKLRGGAVVGDIYEGTVMFKLPWPFETAQIYEVSQIRSLVLGPKPLPVSKVNIWTGDAVQDPDRYPYIVAAPTLSAQALRNLAADEITDSGSSGGGANLGSGNAGGGTNASGAPASGDAAVQAVTQQFALVEADLIMKYRIKPDGLRSWLDFCNGVRLRKSPLDMRERTLRDMAMREVTQYLATQPMDTVMSPRGDSLVKTLQHRIQAAYDQAKTGVEVVAVQVPVLRPPSGENQGMFEEISINVQNARKVLDEAERTVNTTMATLIGGREQAANAVAAIEQLRAIEREKGESSPEAMEQRAAVENMLLGARAQTASVIARARARRWGIVMDAAGNAAEVLGQSPSYRAAPEIYKQRRTMEVLAAALSGVRVKYLLGAGAESAAVDITMQQPEAGLNIADYLEKPQDQEGKK